VSQLRRRKQFWAGTGLDVRFARLIPELAVGFAAGSVYMLALFALELVLGLIQVREFAVNGGGLARDVFAFGIGAIGGRSPRAWSGTERLARAVSQRGSGAARYVSGRRSGACPACQIRQLYQFLPLDWAALFACIYLATGRLSTAIGFHLALNFVEGSVLGFPVSGQLFGFGSPVSQVRIGPDVLTGGAYGPEAGLVGIGSRVLLLAATIAWLVLNRQPECRQRPTVGESSHQPCGYG
jgi:hypothetical protein